MKMLYLLFNKTIQLSPCSPSAPLSLRKREGAGNQQRPWGPGSALGTLRHTHPPALASTLPGLWLLKSKAFS